MKNIKNILGLLFLAVAFVGQPSYSMQSDKSVDASVKRVDKEMSLLDQIVEQANIVVDEADQKARTQAKKKLTKLMESKDLDEKIKEAIEKDIRTIKNPRSKREMHEARVRLLNIYGKINTQANVVEAIAHATKMVENASPEEFDAVLIESKQIIEKAEEEQQGIIGRWYAKAKRIVTAPVNYVFGEESSRAKTAFYAAVGLAIVAAGTYGLYQYGVGVNGSAAEKKDIKLEILDEMIADYSKSEDNATLSQRYRREVDRKAHYQIEKYVHEREKELRSEDHNKNIDAQMHALKEFKHFFLETYFTPGRSWGRYDAVLLRNPDNLSKNSPYLKELNEIMSANGSRTDLLVNPVETVMKSTGLFNENLWIIQDREEFLRTLQKYNEYILENEKALSEKVHIPSNELYKSELSGDELERIEELEKSMEKPTSLWERLQGKK